MRRFILALAGLLACCAQQFGFQLGFEKLVFRALVDQDGPTLPAAPRND